MRNKRLFYALMFFLAISSFSYVFSGITELNLPKYYPVLREWSMATLEGVGMSFYAKVAVSLAASLVLSVVFYVIFPLLSKFVGNTSGHVLGFAQGVIVISLFFFIGEEWHKWGIEKRKLDNGLFFNKELGFYIILLILFMGLFAALAVLNGRDIKPNSKS